MYNLLSYCVSFHMKWPCSRMNLIVVILLEFILGKTAIESPKTICVHVTVDGLMDSLVFHLFHTPMLILCIVDNNFVYLWRASDS